MTAGNIYRCLLWLYPREFRQEFSAEMLSVFEQRAGERFANRDASPVAFLLIEFLSIVKGANIMWLAKILPTARRRSHSNAAGTETQTLSLEETTKLRSAAVKKMVAAIADHDFTSARRYSDEEARLKHNVEEFQREGQTDPRRLA